MTYGNLNVDTVTTSTAGGVLGAGNASLMKNRIINGACVIDQRNAGAAVTVNADADFYPVDRWVARGQGSDGVFTAQQSSVAPAGFVNSVKYTVTTADSSVGATQYYFISQRVEGYNVADLNWGGSNAKTVTLSFWVQSSVTGTYGGCLSNSGNSRSYPFTYTISAANTWTQISVTIAGDTSGTWLTTNGVGLYIYLGLGIGSTYSGTAGSWAGATYLSATGSTNWISTNAATFYITGVQLEVGSSATGFEYRQYGQELALCQRYFEKSFDVETAPSNGTATTFSTTNGMFGGYGTNRGGGIGTSLVFKVPKRATPSIGYWGNSSGYWAYTAANDGTFNWSGNVYLTRINQVGAMTNQQQADGVAYFVFGHWTASAEL